MARPREISSNKPPGRNGRARVWTFWRSRGASAILSGNKPPKVSKEEKKGIEIGDYGLVAGYQPLTPRPNLSHQDRPKQDRGRGLST